MVEVRAPRPRRCASVGGGEEFEEYEILSNDILYDIKERNEELSDIGWDHTEREGTLDAA